MDVDREGIVRVAVYDHANKAVDEASVSLTSADPGDGSPHELKHDRSPGAYVARGLPPGRYKLRAEAAGLASEEREVELDPAGLETLVILGKPGLPFFYRADVKVPFDTPRDLMGVALAPDGDGQASGLAAAARRLKLKSARLSRQIARQDVRVYRLTEGTAEHDLRRVEQTLGRLDDITVVGSIVRFDRQSLSFLSGELVVKFKSDVTPDTVRELATSHRLTTLRPLPQAGNAFLFRPRGRSSRATLAVAADLVETGLVEYAEPNLFGTVVDDAINPTDFLYPMQWYLPLIHCPEAWCAVSQAIAPAVEFGSPDVIIAVVDSGVDVGNPDFTGTVSDGSAKVCCAFDFRNMVANNDTRTSGHGTCCAGIATALANNPAGGAPPTEGVAGAAGNCRLMAIGRPAGEDTAYSDMYMWTGGLTADGNPDPSHPAADIITSSFGVFPGCPIGGLMADTFDKLTTQGRGGRGVLLFFSVGDTSEDFTQKRPWAAYTRTFAVAASALAADGITETHDPASNFGGAATIDFCAPAGNVTAADRDATDSLRPDAPSRPTTETTIRIDRSVGATTLPVAGTAGFAEHQFIVIGPLNVAGAEFNRVMAPPDATNLTVPVRNLSKQHPVGSSVATGPANSLSSFGGTSASTPLAAGVAALVLTVRPDLTWTQVRDILRATAIRIDAANTDPTGIWVDQSQDPSNPGPFYSRWYGFGRVDALAAVNAALNLP